MHFRLSVQQPCLGRKPATSGDSLKLRLLALECCSTIKISEARLLWFAFLNISFVIVLSCLHYDGLCSDSLSYNNQGIHTTAFSVVMPLHLKSGTWKENLCVFRMNCFWQLLPKLGLNFGPIFSACTYMHIGWHVWDTECKQHRIQEIHYVYPCCIWRCSREKLHHIFMTMSCIMCTVDLVKVFLFHCFRY